MIRAMTNTEIAAGLRCAAVVCVEQQRYDWWDESVCVADATFLAARRLDDGIAIGGTPEHAAFFLLLCAEASDA